ncbi:Sulfide dehydrogenase [flavocytochrome c] flavoprotein chain precursor [Hartmannibacter diazotrophicus]|uniref:Sulfide dehydrogenase [flavocytochrome c] flavoprotein chain n=1 Tax=Hartmannibacter diazotrophicus TaxID=1482074 RepID=A0A2C9D4C5_9HYPH|nr:NAD(P)/FAD-dependent oxidoreductase [Hartmannibacter diazotrophicus]SON55018.1 Sulfide dehydrogenase [flavocytochrome c] flavoprotein chain precursor [Hartmannibacter diazotrophicus]
MLIDRRNLLKVAGAAAGTLAMPAVLRAQTRPQIVIVGGGVAGATCALQLARSHPGAFYITLVEEDTLYTTCFFSNLYLGGLRDFESLRHSYSGLLDYDINVINERALLADRDNKVVTLISRTRLEYDRLVLAPGIDLNYEAVPGYTPRDARLMPHAWKAGRQTQLLKQQLDYVKDGSTILILAPPNPYRCPPGPYERASMMARTLKATGRGNAKIVILDAKEKFSKQALFMEGWESRYPGMIEWLPPSIHGGIRMLHPDRLEVETDLDTFKGALVNVIPPQHAGVTAYEWNLVDEASGWCPVDPMTMRSKLDESVFILGDAAIAGDMPKSAFSANSHAKIAARAIASDLLGTPSVVPRYFNTCWSSIDENDAVKVGALYEATPETITTRSSFISQLGESAEVRKAAFEESEAWYRAIVADMLGSADI